MRETAVRVKVGEETPEGGANGSTSGQLSLRLPTVATVLKPFYRTAALPCPYIEGRTERKLITEISGRDLALFYSELSRAGFRRSHHLAYRPACRACNSCLPVRVPVASFQTSRSLRRVLANNHDLVSAVEPARASSEQYRVFTRYQRSRHADSDMASMTYGDYRAMTEDSPVPTFLITMRRKDQSLLGACLVDLLDDGLSAVYSYFDPAESARSPGTLAILMLIEEARRRTLPYVYLGYWIGESRKMAYKIRFRPLEALTNKGWAPLNA
jgi:leucyl-tRNA---protein transferase